ncbi:hypothetical protein HX109_13440 [Galbibacter sp. BG1]|uniref:hypothetical protein n=1 Tax=Galbibacter sp. BG1 TaxID=1170699 RepID=UPI0015BC3625|nr:hypothetical protein [Galbibacter sp. BG1]QLE02511.1 hypothetical protein HX109_13440 [Galbibacter sp. BG1]
MKNLILITAIALGTTIGFAQNKEVLEETVTTTTKVKTSKGEQELKEKVTVTKEQEVNLSEQDKNALNQDRASSPTKVTKQETIMEGDTEVVIDRKTTFMCEDNRCEFIPFDKGFTINSENQNLNATSYQSENNKYMVETKDGKGVGYFDANENFIVVITNDDGSATKRVYKQE